MTATTFTAAADRLTVECAAWEKAEQSALAFLGVSHVYHPLIYARAPCQKYWRRYAGGRKKILFVGMNPGPWGMAQTGIPFGDVPSVRDWLGINAPVGKPENEHPKRPVSGFSCRRREASGQRWWSLIQARYPLPDDFFAHHLVLNYCPLLFLREDGQRVLNITPDKLPAQTRAPLFDACDSFLHTAVELTQVQVLIGIGGFAAARILALFGEQDGIRCGKILHPSPANPAANRGFESAATAALKALSIGW